MSKLQALIHDGRIDPLLLSPADGDGDLSAVQQIGKNPDVDTGSEDLIDGGASLTVPTAARVHALVSSSANDTGGKGATGTITITDYAQMLANAALGRFTIVDSDKMTGIQAQGSITVVDWQLARYLAASGTILVSDYTLLGALQSEGSIEIVDYTKLNEASAVATVTVADYADLAGATLTVGATTLTEGAMEDWVAAVDNDTTATSLAAAIDGISGISASAVGAVITITVDAEGVAGNSTTLTSSDPADLVITAGFAGGRDNVEITVGAHTYVAGSDFTAATSNDATATSLASAIDAETDFAAAAVAAVITVTVTAPGVAGDAEDLESTDETNVTITAFAGGRDAATVTVGEDVLTANVDFNAATDNATTAENLKVAIHALTGVSATRNTATVTITADAEGAAGNSKALTTDAPEGALTLSAATLTGGQDGVTITLDETNLVESTDFTAVTSNAATATALASAIDGISGYSASAVGAVVTIIADLVADGGDDGNVALVTDKESAATVSGATLTGGRSRTILTVDNDTYVAEEDFDVDTEDDAITARNLAAAITAAEEGYTASVVGDIVTVVDDDENESGNSSDLLTSNTDAVTVSAATLTGGEDLATITVNGVAFVAGDDFTPETSHAVTAANLAAAINASEDVLIDGVLTASVSGAVITITAVAVGTGGNSITLATDDSDSSSVSGATLSGGRAHGTGARTVYIEGLSSAGAVISETVILNGTSAVNTVNSYLRINKMTVTTVGSGGVAAGNITATAATDSTVTIRVLTGNNSAFSGFYTVPTGYTLYVVGVHGAFLGGTGGIGTVAVQTRAPGAGFIEQASTTFNVDLETEHEKRISPAVAVPAGYDVKLVGTTDTDNSVMRGQLDAILVAN